MIMFISQNDIVHLKGTAFDWIVGFFSVTGLPIVAVLFLYVTLPDFIYPVIVATTLILGNATIPILLAGDLVFVVALYFLSRYSRPVFARGVIAAGFVVLAMLILSLLIVDVV